MAEVFVRNLDPRVTEELLCELFLQCGPIARVHIPVVRFRGRGFGAVHSRLLCCLVAT
jgi:RNA recognition motif-containing protein